MLLCNLCRIVRLNGVSDGLRDAGAHVHLDDLAVGIGHADVVQRVADLGVEGADGVHVDVDVDVDDAADVDVDG